MAKSIDTGNVRKFMLKKFPTNKYMDCPVPQHHWATIQEYAYQCTSQLREELDQLTSFEVSVKSLLTEVGTDNVFDAVEKFKSVMEELEALKLLNISDKSDCYLIKKGVYDKLREELEAAKKEIERLKGLVNTPTIGKLISDAIHLHELDPVTIDKELKLLGTLIPLMQDKFYPNSIPIILFKNLLLSLHIPFTEAKIAMYKTLEVLKNNEPEFDKQDYKKRQAQALWENEESLTKYIDRLEELFKSEHNL